MRLLIPFLFLWFSSSSQTVINSHILGSSASTLNNNIISFWKLDELSGNVIDASSGANTGTPQGTGTILFYGESGKLNTAIRFNEPGSASSRIDMGDPANLQLTSTGSIAFWYKPVAADLTSTPGLASKMNWNTDRNGYGVFIVSAHPVFQIANASAANLLTLTSTTMTAGTYYHIAFTWDGSTIKGYVNGSLVSSMSQTVNATSSGINFTLGRAWNGTNYANFGAGGTMDEAGIWNRALTAAEVTEDYNSGTGKTCCIF